MNATDAELSAIVFDAYGTLFDVHSVIRRCEEFWPGQGDAISRLWRAKQLEYTWLRSLMGRYADFEHVTGEALAHAAQALGVDLTEAQRAALMQQYRRLDLFPDALPALRQLAPRRLAILSNGAPDMLQAAVTHAGLAALVPDVISVHALRTYKPRPEVYQLAVDRLGVARERIGFVSSNGWDACGAKSFGFRTFWVNRNGAPADALDVAPDHVIDSLAKLPALLAR